MMHIITMLSKRNRLRLVVVDPYEEESIVVFGSGNAYKGIKIALEVCFALKKEEASVTWREMAE